jgi:allophanate hydrolase subunit 2
LLRVRDGEVASQGLLPGAIQVPPDGRPVIVFADHPVTGGYPIVAVVATSDLDLLAQLRPGRSVRLRAGRSAGAP